MVAVQACVLELRSEGLRVVRMHEDGAYEVCNLVAGGEDSWQGG